MSSLVVTPSFHEERRRSVLPTNTQNLHRPPSSTLDPESAYSEDSGGSSLLRRASFAANSFRQMSRVFRDEGPAKGFLRVAIGDQNRSKYIQLAMESDELHAEWKRLRGYVANFVEEYKISKEAVMLDPYRRYKRLCAMVKKLVLHMRLNDLNPGPVLALSGANGRASSVKHVSSFSGGQVLQSSVREKEMRQKHTNICDSLTSEELAKETEKLKEKNSEMQGKIDALIDKINELSNSYDERKRISILFRYLHLKIAVKTFLESDPLDN